MNGNKVVAVFGIGTFGFALCQHLAGEGGKVIAVDKNPKIIDKLKDIVAQALIMDSTDQELLRNAGLDEVDVAVVTMADDIPGSVLTTALLQKIGIPLIIARASSDVHAQVLQQIGASEVINIEIEEGKRLAKRLIAPNVLDIIPIAKGHAIAEIRVPKAFYGKTLLELNVRRKYDINIIIIKRMEVGIDDAGDAIKEERVLFPQPTDILKIDDILMVMGKEQDIARLKDI
jgi:trk system potassium uptake protein TrkA